MLQSRDYVENVPLISVRNLKTRFFTDEGVVRAVDGVSFDVERGKTLAIVGESGCGKSVTALSLIRLVQDPPGKIVSGEVVFEGVDLLRLKEREMRKYRGSRLAMVFQEPMTSLNPVFTVGDQIAEVYRLHHGLSRRQAREKSIESLKLVGIPIPEQRIKEYPHQLSGGMRQRVLIAMALACRPKLLIADEPTTALDVTVQAQILELLGDLKKKLEMTVLLITHDLGIVAQNTDDVAVMYAGIIVEKASTERLFEKPLHPYTQALANSLLAGAKKNPKGEPIPTIPGSVPDLTSVRDRCRFADRCHLCDGECTASEPRLREIEPGHFVRCVKA